MLRSPDRGIYDMYCTEYFYLDLFGAKQHRLQEELLTHPALTQHVPLCTHKSPKIM